MARKGIIWLTCFLAKMHFRGRKSKTHHKPCEDTAHIHSTDISGCQEAVRLRESQLPKAVLPQCLLPKSVGLDHTLLGKSEEISQCYSCLDNSPNSMQTALWNKATKECCSRARIWAARCKIYYDTMQGISEMEGKAFMCLCLLSPSLSSFIFAIHTNIYIYIHTHMNTYIIAYFLKWYGI